MLVDEFAEYAYEDIADFLQLKLDPAIGHEVKLEIAHAIRSVIDELPSEEPSPALQLRQAALETLGNTDSAIVKSLVVGTNGTSS